MTRRRHPSAAVLLVGALVTASVLVNGTVASAAWTKALSLTGSVTAGTLATSATVTVRDATITNDDYQTTHVIEATNNQPATSPYTGTSEMTVTANPVAATGLGAGMSVAIWPVAAAANCTDTSEPVAGFRSAAWTAGLTSDPVAVLPEASAFFCVRGFPTASTPSPSAPAEVQNRVIATSALSVPFDVSADGSQSFTPTYTATVQRGNFTAQAATIGPTTISTSTIYNTLRFANNGSPGNVSRPLSPTGTCWSVSGGGDTSPPGAALVASTGSCATVLTVNRNERFIFIPVPTITTATRIRADSTVAANGFLEANADGTLVEAQTDNVNQLRQLWLPQQTASGSQRQYVNAATGLCAQAPAAANGTFTTAPCTTDNRFRSNWFVASE